jgi:Tol biopolymer transport system component
MGAPVRHLWTISADGSGPTVPLIESAFPLKAHGWSPDGTRLLYQLAFGDQKTAERTLVDDDARVAVVAIPKRRILLPHAALSPDGHWVAYSSNQSGRFDDLRREFPDARKASASVDRRWDTTRNGAAISGSCTLCRRIAA